MNIEQIETKFSTFYKQNDELQGVVDAVKKSYSPKLKGAFAEFRSSKIRDDRYDDDGNYHDLRKSVYRTIRMRNSRNLDLNLQKYTAIKQIKSESPIDLTFIQYVDPQIIFDLWDKYQVASYMKPIWNLANTPVFSAVIGGLIVKYVDWKAINGNTNRHEKLRAKQEFESSKNKNGKELDELTVRLVDSVLKANERLGEEIKHLRKEVARQQDKSERDEEEIKRLKGRLDQLENIEVSAKLDEAKF